MRKANIADQLLWLASWPARAIDNVKLVLDAPIKVNAQATMNKTKLVETMPDGSSGDEMSGYAPPCPHCDAIDGDCMMCGWGGEDGWDCGWNARGREPSPVMKTFIMHEIIEAVSKCTGVPVGLMCSPSRRSAAVRARWVAMYLARKKTQATLEEIGIAFKRDHSSVIHGIKTVKKDRSLIDCAQRVQAELC